MKRPLAMRRPADTAILRAAGTGRRHNARCKTPGTNPSYCRAEINSRRNPPVRLKSLRTRGGSQHAQVEARHTQPKSKTERMPNPDQSGDVAMEEDHPEDEPMDQDSL